MSYTHKGRTYAEFAKFYDNRVVFYQGNVQGVSGSRERKKTNPNPQNKKYTGKMTYSGKKTIEKRLTAWFNSIDTYNYLNYNSRKVRKHLPIMITLTLSQFQTTDDKYIKRNMLQVFIKDLQYNFNVKYYFWKAEKQKNGNLHFHLLIDRFIPMRHIQKSWNRIQKKQGYLNNYYKDKGHYNAPSTHVKSIYKSKNKVQYVMKYVSKDDSEKIIEGSVFRFSKGLIKLSPLTSVNEDLFSIELKDYLDKNTLREYRNEYAALIYTKKTISVKELKGLVQKEFIKYYYNLYMSLYPGSDSLEKKLSIN